MQRQNIPQLMVWLLLLALAYTRLNAQNDTSNSTKSSIWTLKACVDYAKAQNITLNSLRLTAKTAEQNLTLSQNAKMPNLSASVSQGLTNYTASGLKPSSGYGVSSAVTLYNGGYLNNDIQSKTLAIKAANLDIITSENSITLQIAQAYLNILLAKENVVYLQEVVNTSKALVTQGEQRFAAGTIAKKDLLQLQATLANDQYTLVTGENTVRQNTLSLKLLLQLPTNTSFNTTEPDNANAQKLVATLTDAQQTALQTRPEIKSSEISVTIQQAELAKAKAGLKPVVTANASLYSGYSKDNTYTYFNQINNNFYQQIGVTISLPLFDRKTTKTNVAKANIAINQAKLNLDYTKTTLTQSVEQAYINVQNAQSQYTAAEVQLNYTKEAYRIGNEQLAIGVYNTVEYQQQKNLYIQALQSFVQAKYATALYTKIYNFYTGLPITEQ